MKCKKCGRETQQGEKVVISPDSIQWACPNCEEPNALEWQKACEHSKLNDGLEGCEISEQMLTAAMGKAVELGFIPKWADEETYLKNWAGIKAILKAAAAA